MKNQRIPEHKLNVTNTAGQAVENMTSENSANPKGKRQNKKK